MEASTPLTRASRHRRAAHPHRNSEEPLDTSVGRPEIQGFVGALHGQSANQGVFITTGRFGPKAREYAEGVATRVVLIDGQRLAALMIRYGVGVQVRRSVQIVEVDEDFFE